MQVKRAYLSSISLVLYIVYVFFTLDISDTSLQGTLDLNYKLYAKILAGIIFIYPLERAARGGLEALIHADVLLVLSFIYWSLLDVIQARYELIIVTPLAVKTTFILIALFVLFIQLTATNSFRLPSIVVEASRTDVRTEYLFRLAIICFALGIFYFYKSSYYDIDYMIRALTRPRFSAPWARGVEGGFGAIIEHLKYFGYILPCLAVLILIKDKAPTPRVIAAFAMAIFFSAFEFQGGGRRITGFLVGVAVATYMVAERKNLKIKHMVIAGLAGAALLVLLDMQLAFRNKGYQNMLEQYDIEQLNEIRVDDNFLRIAQIVDFIPNSYPYAGAQYLIYSFGRPIPRALWPSKPISPGFDMAEMAGEFGVTLTTTVVGEAYASYGYFMISVMAIFYGMLAGSLNTLLRKDLGILGFAIYALGTLALVGGVRALVDLIIFSYGLLGLIVLYKYVLKGNRLALVKA